MPAPPRDLDLAVLEARIAGEVRALKGLEAAIDAAGTDEDSAARSPEPAVGGSSPLFPAEGEHSGGRWAHHGKLQLKSRHRRSDRPSSQKKRSRDQSQEGTFSLREVAARMEAFIASQDDALELEPFTRLQRKKVRALAQPFGLEIRACGRKGQTCFKTDAITSLSDAARAQVESIVGCDFSPPRGRQGTGNLRKAAAAAGGLSTLDAKLQQPLPEANQGYRMLQRIGWQQGNGLGLHGQGQVDPIALVRRRKRSGLGCDA